TGDSQYRSILLWVDKDNGALMRMEGYDSAGKMIKRFEVVSAQKIENRWYLKQMRVERIDPQSGRVTARTYLEITKEPVGAQPSRLSGRQTSGLVSAIPQARRLLVRRQDVCAPITPPVHYSITPSSTAACTICAR